MTDRDAWDEVRECALAANTNPAIIITQAKADGIAPEVVVSRFHNAWAIRHEYPDQAFLPFGFFAATPPGFFDIRTLFQRDEPIWWVDILRSPFQIEDTKNFTDARLDGAIAYLRDHAGELLKGAIAAQLAPDDLEDGQNWIRRTPLWRDLHDEIERRRQGEGRSPIVAMQHPGEHISDP
ncbi:hypothetical protein ACFQ9V_13250 [Leifsonia sp. NPDC056665]|uniref:hypothetical protein n=1 Tax=Leifsonia sp. NPDC056665 TaxID=3345901 RepID=UPI00368723D7